MVKPRISLLLLILLALACNSPSFSTQSEETPSAAPTSASPTEPPTRMPSQSPLPSETSSPIPPTSTTTPDVRGVFRVAILVDTSSDAVESSLAEQALYEASDLLYQHTGFVFELTDFTEIAPPEGTPREQLVDQYIESNLENLPDGIVYYTWGTDNATTVYGGFSTQASVPDPTFRNHFRNIRGVEDRIYVANNHWGHRYAQCGYGDATLEEPVSDVGIEGECRNQPGTPCVDKYGYSMCSTAVDDRYASTATYFAGSTILHEFLHPFGMQGAGDHYGTPTCQEQMGWDESNWTFELSDAQLHAGMCPHVFENFVAGYQP